MANLEKVIKVTQAQYDTLASGGTVGSYTGLNDNYVYLVEDNNEYLPVITVTNSLKVSDLPLNCYLDGGTVRGVCTRLSGLNNRVGVDIVTSSGYYHYFANNGGNTLIADIIDGNVGEYREYFLNTGGNIVNSGYINFCDDDGDTRFELGSQIYDDEIIYLPSDKYMDLLANYSYSLIYSENGNYLQDFTLTTNELKIYDADDSGMVIGLNAAGSCIYTSTHDYYLPTTSGGTFALTSDLNGRVDRSFLNANEFSTSSTYAVGDRVTRNGKLYKCTTAVTTAGAWDASKWTEVTLGTYVTTDTTQTITETKTFNKYILINKSDTWSGGYGPSDTGHGLRVVTPNMVTGNRMVFLDGGKALNTNNSAHFDFGYVSDGSTDNFINMGFYANDNRLKIYANGVLQNNGSILPTTSATYDLGSSTYNWKDLYLDGSLKLKGTTTTYNLTVDDTYNELRIQNGDTRYFTINSSGLMPSGTRSLGSSSYKFLDLYLSGKIDFGNNNYITNTNNLMTFYYNNSAKFVVGSSYVMSTTFIPTSTNSVDLGRSDYQWKDLYLAGNLTDGTNSIAVADIQSKIEIKRFI